jgi:RNA methyltransferase, TrmH family
MMQLMRWQSRYAISRATACALCSTRLKNNPFKQGPGEESRMITSLSNERIKSIRKLQERKSRQESGLFFVEGLRIVAEALEQAAAGRAEVDTLLVAPDLLKSPFGRQLVAEQHRKGVLVLEVSADVFERLSAKEGPQGIAAVMRQRWLPLAEARLQSGAALASHTWVALDSVADPGNLGTILRTHDAVGGQGVILLDQSTDPYDPAAARGSMGALFTQALVRASFSEFAEWKRQFGYPVIGTSDKADLDYHKFSYPPALVLLMGSERQGLQEHHLALCDALVSIPMLGKNDSLNLAVATAVVLYEILNQRREKR